MLFKREPEFLVWAQASAVSYQTIGLGGANSVPATELASL